MLALLTALVLNNLLAHRIAQAETRLRPVARVPESYERVPHDNWAEEISERNLFNSAPPEEEAFVPPKPVRQIGEYHFEVDRAEWVQQTSWGGCGVPSVRTIPQRRGGELLGYKIVGVRPGTSYAWLGLRSGDVITRVAGQRLDPPGAALALYRSLRNADEIIVSLERRGRPLTFRYTLR